MKYTAQDHCWLGLFLWMSTVAWGIGLGAKLFEFTVVISAWAVDPPASLSLMPYGPHHPYDPGDFFLPLSILLLIGTVGAIFCGRNAVHSYKVLLWIGLACLLFIWIATPTLFWPMISDLYYAGTGDRPLQVSEAQTLVNRWLVLDWMRTALITVGFFSAIQAISSKHRAFEA